MINPEFRTPSQESAARFIPQDHPELWQRFSEKIKQSQGSLVELNHYPGKGELSQINREVVDMFIPRAIQPPEGLDNVTLNWLLNSLDINIAHGQDMSLELSGYIDKDASDKPGILEISDYDADLPTPGGTQIFYRNLLHQLAHMGTPVVYGQKVPTSLSFFMHRIGQVPVALLDNKFKDVQERICRGHRSVAEMREFFNLFSYTVKIYGVEQLDMLAPEYREKFQTMQQAFNEMDRNDRVGKYNTLLCDTFSLKSSQ